MAKPIEAELNLLHKEFISMGNMVFDALRTVTSSVLNNDSEHIPELIANDKVIDGRENTIDNHCIKLWATKAPVAHDLRLLFCIIRSTNELERLGDHAKDIGRSLLVANAIGPMPLDQDISHACQEVLDVFDKALQAYQKDDSALAQQCRLQCKEGKKRFKTYNQNTVKLIKTANVDPTILLEMHTIAKHLQRIYAIIGNMCKNTIYLLDGEMVRHGGREHPLTDA